MSLPISNQDPDSRVALVTGGSRGIGLAMVNAFRTAGWRVAACAREAENLKDNPADLKFSCDVASATHVKAGIALVIQQLGRLDAVINNAGIAGSNDLDTNASDELWRSIIDTNLHGTYHVSKYSLPHLPRDGTGRIINIASVLALKGVPDQTAYCAAKHGVLGFTRALAHHTAPHRITVNAICPGWVRTEMAAGRMAELNLTEKQLEEGVPLRRFIEPAEVAELALYLASAAASGITGQALTIDGGSLA
jgi:NAD(P)-dependent dehydrogenase (short-subunit alcohol dehydrogenase family)